MSVTNGQSVQSDVLDAVVAVLNGAGLAASRCRFSPTEADELPAENVIPEDETPEYVSTDDIDQKMRFQVRHEAAAISAVDKAVDARYVLGQRALLAEPTLGGLTRTLRYAGMKWERERGELDTIALVAMYECEYSTKRNDPSAPGF